jgi:hypothetical protein
MSMVQNSPRRTRRTVAELIADLEAQIAGIKAREAQKRAKADPARKHAAAALKLVDKALAEAKDPSTRKSLAEARSALGACLGLDEAVIVPARTRRSANEIEDLAGALLSYVRSNPSQRGEQIAAAMGSDAKTIRPVMKRLIADGKIATEGERRGMTYTAV